MQNRCILLLPLAASVPKWENGPTVNKFNFPMVERGMYMIKRECFQSCFLSNLFDNNA